MAQTSKRPKKQAAQGKRKPQPQRAFTEVSERITKEFAPVVDESGLYLEEVKVGRQSGGMVVRVVVDLFDGPGGVDSEALADLSRAFSRILDDVDLVQGSYTLEVSTPGAERMLSEARHFSRSIGRLVSFRKTDGSVLVARITGVDGTTVSVSGEAATQIPLSDIASARVQVELGRAQEEEQTDES